MTLKNRISAAIQAAGSSQAQLSRDLGVQRSTVSHWCLGRRVPSVEQLTRVAAILGVRAAWLAVGDGPMVEARPRGRRALARTAAADATTTQAA